MTLIERHNLLPRASDHSFMSPWFVVLHDTAGPTLHSAEETLKQRGLGYHYMIDKDGVCYEYALPSMKMSHAAGYNTGSVSISYVGGGGYGKVNDTQIQASIDLINEHITKLAHSLRAITGHKHASNSGKIDPEFDGDDDDYMNLISEKTGLEFLKFN